MCLGSVEGRGELIGIGIARPLDVHVTDGGEGKGYLGLVKYPLGVADPQADLDLAICRA